MPRFRVLIQSESADPNADWFGFYATRDHEADSEVTAQTLALAAIRDEWSKGGDLSFARALACWSPRPWHRQMTSGCTFYDDDPNARAEALSIETEGANAPRDVRALAP